MKAGNADLYCAPPRLQNPAPEPISGRWGRKGTGQRTRSHELGVCAAEGRLTRPQRSRIRRRAKGPGTKRIDQSVIEGRAVAGRSGPWRIGGEQDLRPIGSEQKERRTQYA